MLAIDKEKVVNESLSLEDGAVDFWQQKYKDYQIECLAAAFHYFGIDIPANKPVQEYTEIQKIILYDGVECDFVKETFPDLKIPKTVSGGRFEEFCRRSNAASPTRMAK